MNYFWDFFRYYLKMFFRDFSPHATFMIFLKEFSLELRHWAFPRLFQLFFCKMPRNSSRDLSSHFQIFLSWFIWKFPPAFLLYSSKVSLSYFSRNSFIDYFRISLGIALEIFSENPSEVPSMTFPGIFSRSHGGFFLNSILDFSGILQEIPSEFSQGLLLVFFFRDFRQNYFMNCS